MSGSESRLRWRVRSPPRRCQLSPRLGERKRWLAAKYTVAGSCGETRIGALQFQRYGRSPGTSSGLIVFVSPVCASKRTMPPFCDSA